MVCTPEEKLRYKLERVKMERGHLVRMLVVKVERTEKKVHPTLYRRKM